MIYRYENRCGMCDSANGAVGVDLGSMIPLDASPVPTLVIHQDTLRFLAVNDVAVSRYGYSRDEFLGMRYSDIHKGPAGERLLEQIAQASQRDDGFQHICEHQLRDGRIIDVKIASKSFDFLLHPAFLVTSDDITHYRIREREAEVVRNREAAILNAIPDLFFEIDLEGRIHSFHSGHKDKLVMPESDFIGKLVSEIFPENIVTPTMTAIRQANMTGISTGNEYELLIPGETAPSWFEYSVARMDSAEYRIPRFIVLSRDVTARKKAEKELQDSQDFVKATLDNLPIGVAINSVSPEVTFQYANQNFFNFYRIKREEIVGPDSFWTAVYEEPNYREEIKKRVLTDVASGDERQMVWEEIAIPRSGKETRYVSARNIPLSNKGVSVSLVWDVTEAKMARDALSAYVQKLETSMMGTVEVAMTISQMRDPYTVGHERRVAAIAEAIATELALDANRIQGVRIGAYLHDVGKIVVPAEILTRPGRLTTTEFDIIKSHAEAGYDILKAVEFPWPIAEIARSHHERLDGSGYPRKLRGSQIILEARIVAVADVVEAMSSHRPYRAGLGIEKALAEIERGSGTAYDADVVKACMTIFRERGFSLSD